MRYLADEGEKVDPMSVILKHPDYENFWDAESFNWDKRIVVSDRKFILDKLSKCKGRMLNLGSGTDSYDKNSVSVDYSKQMLKKNTSKSKLLYDLDGKTLPFRDDSFNSVVCSFFLNYIDDIDLILDEILRVLVSDGELLVFQGSLNKWYQKQSKHKKDDVISLLKKKFVLVSEEKHNYMTFLRMRNEK